MRSSDNIIYNIYTYIYIYNLFNLDVWELYQQHLFKYIQVELYFIFITLINIEYKDYYTSFKLTLGWPKQIHPVIIQELISRNDSVIFTHNIRQYSKQSSSVYIIWMKIIIMMKTSWINIKIKYFFKSFTISYVACAYNLW